MTYKRVAGVVLVGGLAVIAMAKVGAKPPGEPFVPESEATQPALVEAVSATVGMVTESVQAVGTLQAVASITVRPEIAGVIRRINFSDGQPVERGDVLIELDQDELRAEASQASAHEQMARVTYERIRRLASQQTTIVPVQQVDEARLALEAAEANSVLYAIRLKKTVIRAPFSGTAGFRRVSAGDYVQPGQDVVNFEDLHVLHVDFKVPESWLSRLRVGQGVAVTTDAFPARPFDGQVSAIDPRVEASTRTVPVRAAVPNPQGLLRPGLFATVRLVLGEPVRALLIPEEAVFLNRDRTMVFRIEGDTARLAEVVTGTREHNQVEIQAGLREGEWVVRGGTHKVRDGQRVSIKPAPDR